MGVFVADAACAPIDITGLAVDAAVGRIYEWPSPGAGIALFVVPAGAPSSLGSEYVRDCDGWRFARSGLCEQFLSWRNKLFVVVKRAVWQCLHEWAVIGGL